MIILVKSKSIFLRIAVIFLIIAVIIISAAIFLLFRENSIFRNISFIYPGQQYIATDIDAESVTSSFLIVDSGEYMKSLGDNVAKIKLISSDKSEVEVDTYAITTLKSSSAYNLYKINIDFSPHLSDKEQIEFTQLYINEKKYDIGSLIVEGCIANENENIHIGTAPFSENPEIFPLIITNNEKKPIAIKSVDYFLYGINSTLGNTEENISIEAETEKDISFKTEGFAGNNVTIKPKVIYELDGKEYIILPLVATEYMTSLSKEEIIKYIKESEK